MGDLDCVPATPLGGCAADDQLHPIPGKTYTYTIKVTPAVSSGNVLWFAYNATDNSADIIASNNDITTAQALAEPDDGTSPYLLDATDAAYNKTTGNTAVSIDISWQSFSAATNDILLVAYVKGEAGCSDNIEVWKIEPSFAFTLDIAGLMDNGTIPSTGNANECVSPVVSAIYATGAPGNLTMDYGENYIYFVVNAANYVNSWQPTFSMTNGTETTVGLDDIAWAYPSEAIKATGGVWNPADGTTGIAAAVSPASGASGVGGSGECIIVRVYLDHNDAENDALAARNFILGVDGIMYDVNDGSYTNTALQDLDPAAGPAACPSVATDEAQYDLNPRPGIEEVLPVNPSFVPKN